MCRTLVLGFVLLVAFDSAGLVARADNPASPPNGSAPKSPLSPEESLKHFMLGDPNLIIEIVAAEPEVIDPVAIQFDEHGRLWVVELSDYPNGPEPGKPPMSRIKLLEDKDGDGRYETAHIFADKLLFATGVQPWDGGVIVTLAGEVAFFKDTDGDHKADVRETWFTGFAQANPQLRANHPTFGPDGWIYVANGLRGGNVIAVKKDWPSRLGLRPDPTDKAKVGTESQPTEPQPVSLTGRDFKFDPLTGRYEAISGNGQFGMTFDAWGNRFVCDNRHPCRHVIFEEDFIKRCPHVAFPAVVHDVIPADDKNQVFPLTSAWTTSNLHAGTFTASCGVTVYTGDWLPEEFRGNVFVCEPTGNLVQRAILEPDGVTFKSRNPHAPTDANRRAGGVSPPVDPKSASNPKSANAPPTGGLTPPARQEVVGEFLASRDDWFRPVDLQNGPDGALYVVDMYRAVIEHPEWVPDELKKRPDTWLGNDKGRIYRIRPKGASPKREFGSKIAKLEADFNSANGWHRMKSLRTVFERRGREPKYPMPNATTDFARWLATQHSELTNAEDGKRLIRFVTDPNPRLCERALEEFSRLITESKVEHPVFPRDAVIKLCTSVAASNEDYRVRWRTLQLLAVAHVEIPDMTGDLLSSRPQDTWLRQTGLAATRNEPHELLLRIVVPIGKVSLRNLNAEVRARLNWDVSRYLDLLAAVGELTGSYSPPDDIWRTLESLAKIGSNPSLEFRGLIAASTNGILTGIARRQAKADNPESPLTKQAKLSLFQILEFAQSASESDEISLPLRQASIRLLRHAPFEKISPSLKTWAEHDPDQAFRMSALESFASFQKPEVDAWLIDRYRSETPAIRRAILSALFASKERQLRLLEAIEQGQIAATELDPVRVNQLTQAKDETLRERAKKILAAAAPASRKEVLDAYQPALSLKADPKRGRELFVKNCSTCHRIDNVGVNVAPDISDTRTKKPEQLLLDILDPNKAIDANYFAYAVALKDGTVQSGVISAETATSITLKQPEGKVLTLLRSDIEELRNTGLSLMPVGLEKNVDQQAMGDLIFWLKNWRYLDGKVPATSLK